MRVVDVKKKESKNLLMNIILKLNPVRTEIKKLFSKKNPKQKYSFNPNQ